MVQTPSLIQVGEVIVPNKTETNKFKIFNYVKALFTKDACWIVSASNTNSASLVKPGGTAMLADKICSCKIVDIGVDRAKMGRWSYVARRVKQDQLITIITTYRYNHVNISNTVDSTA